MKMLAHNKWMASFLVVTGFAVLLISGRVIGIGTESYLIGSAAFFIVACFLPETRYVTFLSRRSALSLVGLFVYLAEPHLFLPQQSEAAVNETSSFPIMQDFWISIVAGVGAYWLSVFLIRGFRAKPEYET